MEGSGSESVHIIPDPDPGGPKTYGYGSGTRLCGLNFTHVFPNHGTGTAITPTGLHLPVSTFPLYLCTMLYNATVFMFRIYMYFASGGVAEWGSWAFGVLWYQGCSGGIFLTVKRQKRVFSSTTSKAKFYELFSTIDLYVYFYIVKNRQLVGENAR